MLGSLAIGVVFARLCLFICFFSFLVWFGCVCCCVYLFVFVCLCCMFVLCCVVVAWLLPGCV